jgi:prepilin-type N-terminal cleavage/methylation domain-containing protein
MTVNAKNNKKAFTMIELMVAIMISTFVMLGIAIYIIDIQRGWGNMFGRVHSDIVSDALIARKTFDGVVRQSARYYALSPDSSRVTVTYFSDIVNSTEIFPDRYAEFYTIGNELWVEYGIRSPKTQTRVTKLAENVVSCTFDGEGPAAIMSLQMDNGEQSIDLIHSAILHN